MRTSATKAGRVVAILAAAAGTVTVSSSDSAEVMAMPAPAAEAVRPGEAWLAYESTSWKIRLVRPDGSGDHELDAAAIGPEDNPDWSPDGRRLTFVGVGTDPDSKPGLWVLDANGHGLRRVVDCRGDCQYLDDPAWSPDGTEILYSKQAPAATKGGELEVVNVATGRTRTVLTAAPGDFYAGVRYAPNGHSVVLEWVHASPANYDDVTGVTLTRVDLTGGSPTLTPLTEPELFAETADWSPAGDLIAYAALETSTSVAKDVYVVRPDGSGRSRLTTLSSWGGGHTDFTNDGSGIYFARWTDHGPELQIVDIASRVVRTVGRGIPGFHPRTRPDR